jgi:hypothetical protein
MYTKLKVMQSAAGWYVGRGYLDPDCGGMEVPGSRESEYFGTREEAELELKYEQSKELYQEEERKNGPQPGGVDRWMV